MSEGVAQTPEEVTPEAGTDTVRTHRRVNATRAGTGTDPQNFRIMPSSSLHPDGLMTFGFHPPSSLTRTDSLVRAFEKSTRLKKVSQVLKIS